MSEASKASVLPYIALLANQICWSSFHAIGRYASLRITPFIIPATRSLIATPLLATVLLCYNPSLLKIKQGDIPYFIMLGCIGSGYNQVLFIWGVSLTSAADGGISQPLITIFTLLLAVLCRMEKLTIYKGMGTLISIFGCMLIVGSEYMNHDEKESSASVSSNDRVKGWILFVIQCFVYAVYILLNKRIADRLHPLSVAFWTFAFGTIANLSIGVPFAIMQDWSTVTLNVCLAILYIGVIGTVLPQCFYSYASSQLPPTLTSLAICLSPLISSTMGFVLLNERLTEWDGVGAMFIVLGVVIVVYGRQQELKEAKQYQQLPVSSVAAADQATDVGMDTSVDIPAIQRPVHFYANKDHRSGESIELTEQDSGREHLRYNQLSHKPSTPSSVATTRSNSSSRRSSRVEDDSPQSSSDSDASRSSGAALPRCHTSAMIKQ